MGLARYGLHRHPFREAFSRPLSYPGQRDFFAQIDGFARVQDRVTEWFVQHPELDQPRFFVLEGLQGSGRTSAANFIAHHHLCHLNMRRQQPYEFLKVSFNVKNERDPETLYGWLSALYTEIKRQGISMVPEALNALREFLNQPVEGLPGGAAPFGDVVTPVVQSLQELGRCVVAIFDRVKDRKLYEFCAQVFYWGAPLVIFVEDFQINDKNQRLSLSGGTRTADHTWPPEEMGLLVEFSGLIPDEIGRLIEHCWIRAQGELPHPFDLDNIFAVFGFMKSPTGLAIQTLAELFDFKLARLSQGGQAWPHDPTLEIGLNDIQEFVKSLKNALL